jgi:hypothetical protein
MTYPATTHFAPGFPVTHQALASADRRPGPPNACGGTTKYTGATIRLKILAMMRGWAPWLSPYRATSASAMHGSLDGRRAAATDGNPAFQGAADRIAIPNLQELCHYSEFRPDARRRDDGIRDAFRKLDGLEPKQDLVREAQRFYRSKRTTTLCSGAPAINSRPLHADRGCTVLFAGTLPCQKPVP